MFVFHYAEYDQSDILSYMVTTHTIIFQKHESNLIDSKCVQW